MPVGLAVMQAGPAGLRRKWFPSRPKDGGTCVCRTQIGLAFRKELSVQADLEEPDLRGKTHRTGRVACHINNFIRGTRRVPAEFKNRKPHQGGNPSGVTGLPPEPETSSNREGARHDHRLEQNRGIARRAT